jgi:hypothetical protein
MTERDDDIEFDFFDEGGATQETAVRERAPRRGPRGPVRPPSGITPLLRLVGLVAFAILLVVLLVFWVQSCRGASKKDKYQTYMADVADLSSDSAGLGTRLNSLLTTQIRQAELESRLSGLAQQQQQLVARAQQVDPPGRLRSEHGAVIEAFQFRVSGLRGLEDAFRRTATTKDAAAAAALLATQAQRLVTSDVVWDDRFKDPAVAVLQQEDVTGVAPPDSNFVKTADLATPAVLKPIWQRIHGARTGGASCSPRGTGIASLKALPAGTELSRDTETEVAANTNLAFQANVQDTGCAQEVQVRVTLTIQKAPAPIVRTLRIASINPGETKAVTFRDLGQPPFGNKTTVKLDVDPVRGETNKTNNSYEYPVFFTLGT